MYIIYVSEFILFLYLKDQTRIYLFMGERDMLRKYMDQMRIEQVFSDGKYMVIYVDPKTILPKEFEYALTVRSLTIIILRTMFMIKISYLPKII